MIGTLRFVNVWLVANGTTTRSVASSTATAEETKAIAEWDTKNQQTLGLIGKYMESTFHHYILDDSANASDVWKKLKDDFDKESILANSIAFKALVGTHFDDNKDINTQVQEFLTAIRECKNAGLTIDMIIKVHIFLWALPKSYDTAISAYLGTHSGAVGKAPTLKIEDLIPIVINEEKRRKSSSDESAAISKISQMRKMPKEPCKKCGCSNHSTEQHWDKKPNKKGENFTSNKSNNSNANQNKKKNENKKGNNQKNKFKKKGKGTANGLNVTTDPVYEHNDNNAITISLYQASERKNVGWLIDSGATSHITNDIKDFSHYNPATIPGHCTVAGKGMTLKILGQGKIIMHVYHKDGTFSDLTLQDVLYIPEATMRFFSPIRAMNAGCTSAISSDKWTGHHKGRKLFTGLPDSSGLYWLTGTVIRNTDSVSKISQNDYLLWHNRLGHPSQRIIENLHKGKTGIKSKISASYENSPCHGCLLGKSKRKAFPSSDSRAAKPLKLIHCDLIEFPTLSIDGYKYALTCLDNASSYGQLFYLKRKSDTLTNLKAYKMWAENQTNRKIKIICSDGRSEFINTEFKAFIKEHGIEMQVSVLYTPQQNGRAEQWQQTRKYKAEALQHHAGMSEGFWKLSCEAAIYINNRLPNERLNWRHHIRFSVEKHLI